MMGLCVAGVLCVWAGSVAVVPGEMSLAEFPADALAEMNAQGEEAPEYTVELAPEKSKDGAGSFQVIWRGAGPGTAALYTVPLDGLSGTVIWYRAWIRAEDPGVNAYLEMICTMDDGTTYFSRAVDKPAGKISRDGAWTLCQTPFILKPGNHARSATLGLRFEGPGTVWIDGVSLVREARWMWFFSAGWIGAAFGFVGALGACGGPRRESWSRRGGAAWR